MEEVASAKSHKALVLNTLAFTACFAAWMLNGVLVTFLTNNQVYPWGPVEIGWLMGIPVLTGSLFRLPAGLLTDKYGGKPVFTAMLMFCAVPMYLLSTVDSFLGFALCSFGFGLTGVGFSIGIAFTSVWYPKKNQGTALGIFGAGNAGASLSTLFAPTLLNRFTNGGVDLEGWRMLPKVYAAMLLGIGVLFLIFSTNKKPTATKLTLKQQLEPLKSVRVWRFGLYYFLVFGCFVAFSQWLVPYFVNAYYMPLVTAGILASLFSFPSGVIRALGGWLSDKFGARRVMFWVFATSCIISAAVIVPKMEIYSPGRGVMAMRPGVVSEVNYGSITVGPDTYKLQPKPTELKTYDETMAIFPGKETWQEPAVVVGQKVQKRELLAKGVTRIFFQANVWIYAFLVMVIGIIWGIGKAGVYKYIPDYFPQQVGVVGGMVGVIGGLGGFVCPILFGYLLDWTGLWTSCWMLMLALSIACLWWMLRVVRIIEKNAAPQVAQSFEQTPEKPSSNGS